MEEPTISFKTAKILKEKDIIIDGFYHFNENGTILENSVSFRERVVTHHLYANTYDFEIGRWGGGNPKCIGAPTQTMLQKWLRETHKICVEVNILMNGKYVYKISRKLRNNLVEFIKQVETKLLTHEDALEDGLVDGLNYIKEKNQ